MHMFNVSTLYWKSIKLFHQKALSMHIQKALLGKKNSKFSQLYKFLSSHSCHFVKNYFFWTKLIHAYVQCIYIV